MAILSVKQQHDKQTGPSIRGDWTREWRDTYIVICDDYDAVSRIGTTGSNIVADTRVPQKGTAHDDNANAICTDVDPHQVSETLWYVRVKWSTSLSAQREGNDPLDDPLKYNWSVVHYETVREQDLAGVKFSDPAGTPFVQKPTFPVDHLKLTVTRNEDSYSHLVAPLYANRVNKEKFWGYDAGHVKADMPVASEQERDGKPYWQVTYGFEFKNDPYWDNVAQKVVYRGWNPVYVLNEGPRYKKEVVTSFVPWVVETKVVVAADEVGVSHNGMVLLSDTGYKLQNQVNDNPTYTPFTMYQITSFDVFNL